MANCCCDNKVFTSNVYYDGAYLPITTITNEDNGNVILQKIENVLSSIETFTVSPGTGIQVTQLGDVYTITNTAPNIVQELSLAGNTLSLSNGGGSVVLPIPSGGVTSFNGRTGVVTSQLGDYTTTIVAEGTNLYFTGFRVRTTTLDSLPTPSPTDSAIADTDTVLAALSKLQGQISNRVPLNTSITINGVTQDLSGDRTWTVTETDPVFLAQGTRRITLTPGIYASTNTVTFDGNYADEVSVVSPANYPAGGIYNSLYSTGGLGLSTPFREARFFNVLTFHNTGRSSGGTNWLSGMPAGTRLLSQLIIGNSQLGWQSVNSSSTDWDTDISWAVPDSRTITINGVSQDLTANQDWTISTGGGTVTSVDASITGSAIAISGNPINTSGTLVFTWTGNANQYVNGLGGLTTFPTIPTYTGSTSITLSGGSFQRAALTGDVTAALNSNATTIANNVVTYAKMQDIATQTLIGRGAVGTGDPGAVTIGTGLSLSTGNVLSSTVVNTNLANTNLIQTAATNRTYDMNTNDLTFFNGQFTLGQAGEYGWLHLYEQAAGDVLRLAAEDHQFYIQYATKASPMFTLDFNDTSLTLFHFDLITGFTISGSGVSSHRTYNTPDYSGDIELKQTTTQLITASATMLGDARNILRFDSSATSFDLTLIDPATCQNRTITVTNAGAGNGNITFIGSFLPRINPSSTLGSLIPSSHVVLKSINVSGTWFWIRVEAP